MVDHLRIALAQLNPKVGDLAGNLQLAREALAKAGRRDLIGNGPRCLVPPATGKGALSIHAVRKAQGRSAGGARPAGAKNERRG
mgnify:CR=1 FL=1